MVAQRIDNRIRRQGRGAVFTSKDFLDLGSRAAVDQALKRFASTGKLLRLDRGLYYFPRKSPRLGILSPTTDAVARAVARKTSSRLQVSGARAANMLGLSDQVPARIVFFTDGPSRQVRIGGSTIDFRHASSRRLVGAGKPAGVVLRALAHLGKKNVDRVVIRKVARTLSARDRGALLRDATAAPDWVRPLISQLTANH